MPGFPCMATETLDEALAWCWQQSRPGDAIVLSPGCASTDQFRNFRHRGERFVELVSHLTNRCRWYERVTCFVRAVRGACGNGLELPLDGLLTNSALV